MRYKNPEKTARVGVIRSEMLCGSCFGPNLEMEMKVEVEVEVDDVKEQDFGQGASE